MLPFSIILCAYNAVSRMAKTLEHLAAIDYPSDAVEIILVDNNSTDGTGYVANELWKDLKSPLPLRVVLEKQQGLSSARKRGIQEARFDYLLFCDDDNWLCSQYLKLAGSVIMRNAKIGALGGQGVPVTNAECFPNWFYTYSAGYAVGVQSMKSGDISERGFVWGAGLVVRRDLLKAMFSAGNDLLLSGRKGGELSAGDDCEMCKWFLLAGYQLWYEERMIFHHFIPEERLTRDYLAALFQGFGNSNLVLARYDQLLQLRATRQTILHQPLRWIKCEIEFFLDRNPFKYRVIELARNIKELFAQ